MTSAAFKIDQSRPVIAVSLTPAPSGGWIGSPVTAHFTCNDSGSGIDVCPADQVVTDAGEEALLFLSRYGLRFNREE